MRAAAPVPMTGRYAVQGLQVAAGLKLWAERAGASLRLEDDQSRPQRSAQVFAELSAADCDVILGPYGSDSVRAVARSLPGSLIWNHGAAANDIQRLPNVISIPSPSSAYLLALGRALAHLRPDAIVAVVTASGPFADYAWAGLRAQLSTLPLSVAGPYAFSSPVSLLPSPLGKGTAGVDAVLSIGPVEKELALFHQLSPHRPGLIMGGVSPGLARFPELLADDPEGFLAPVQWHPSLGESPALGPSTAQVLSDARSMGLPALDYVAAQAYAAALVAAHCVERDPHDPQSAARRLRTSTFFGDFELDPETGEQRGHRLAVIQWRAGGQALVVQPSA